MTRQRIAVVGGGITGLAAAFELCTSDSRPEVVIYEASDRLGGRIETANFAGTPIDTGPDSFITRRPAAVELCEQLGLGDHIISPGVSGALVFSRGALHPLPAGTVLGVPTDIRALARSSVLTRRGLLRVAADLVLPATTPPAADPSVADVLAPRIGREAVALLVDPLIGGINAGTSANLSLRSVAPQLADAQGRSIIRSLRAAAPEPPTPSAGAGEPTPKPLFAGVAGGLGRVVDALERRLRDGGVQIELGKAVTGLRSVDGRYELGQGNTTDLVDGVLLTLPAPPAGRLLADLMPGASAELATIRYASVALVTLSYSSLQLPAGGTGILVPRPFRDVITGITFTSVKWPNPALGTEAIVRASVGSIDDEESPSLADDELLRRVRSDLHRVAGIEPEPDDVLIRRFPASFPQYEPGHAARVATMRRALDSHPGLAIAGAAYDGIGIPACIESGRRQAKALGVTTIPATS